MSSKDWTGGYHSVYKTLGASNHTLSERADGDYYATDPVAIDRLLEVYDVPQYVWECACGAGHLSKRLIEKGRTVFSSDLADRGYGHVRMDFLQEKAYPNICDGDCCILTNPPYKYATEFIEHSLDVLPKGCPAIFLLKTTALEGKGRYERLFKKGYLHNVFQFTDRLLCAKNGNFLRMKEGGGSAVSYAWFVFKKELCEAPKIGWV